MELRYCETCGKVLTLQGRSEEIDPNEQYLCSECMAGGARAGRKKVEKKSEKKKGPGSLEFLSSPLEEGNLNLFSGATLVRYKDKRKKEGSGLLGLRVEEPGLPEALLPDAKEGSSTPARTAKKIQFRCLRCQTVLQIQPVKGPSRLVCPKCKLNLFVDETGRISKTPPRVAKPSAPAKTAGGTTNPTNPTSAASGSPLMRTGFRKSAQAEPVKFQFHCLHCRVVLRALAVQEHSRMICPKCKGTQYIDPSGLVSKAPPKVPKVAVKPTVVQPPAPAKARAPAPQPVAPPIPPAVRTEKEAPRPPKPKRARKKKRKSRAKTPADSMVRVSTFLPADLVEVIEETGEAKSKVIREIIEQKVRPPSPPTGGPLGAS